MSRFTQVFGALRASVSNSAQLARVLPSSARNLSTTTARISPLAQTIKTQRALRGQVSDGMLKTYSEEVPLFGELNKAVMQVNQRFVEAAKTNPALRAKLAGDNLEQLGNIRHAAVRIALPEEMEMFTRVMNQLGMLPVAIYNLIASGTPVMSTVFRPVDPADIKENAFTIFTSMLMQSAVDFSKNPELEKWLTNHLEERRQKHFRGEGIFSKRLMELVDKAETAGLTEDEQQEYVAEVVKGFQLNKSTPLDEKTYNELKKICAVTLDIIGGRLNINHLTPDTPDIDAVYQIMLNAGIDMNAFIQGPAVIDILLRQTSFAAQLVKLLTSDGKLVDHLARFGEIESRGAAISITAREIYDKVLDGINKEVDAERNKFKAELKKEGKEYVGAIRKKKEAELGELYKKLAKERFPQVFPATDKEQALSGTSYFTYKIDEEALSKISKEELKEILAKAQKTKLNFSENESQGQKIMAQEFTPYMEALVDAGLAERIRIKYRDFLPASAAGIFGSNKDRDSEMKKVDSVDEVFDWFKRVIGSRSFYDLYEGEQAKAMKEVVEQIEAKGVHFVSDHAVDQLDQAIEKGDPEKIIANHRAEIIPNLRDEFKAHVAVEATRLGAGPAAKTQPIDITSLTGGIGNERS